MTNLLSLLCALAILAGAVVFAHAGSNRVNFVELGAAGAPQGSATVPA